MKHVLIRIAGGFVAALTVVVNYGHAVLISSCGNYSTTLKQTGGVKYRERSCTIPAYEEFSIDFQAMSGADIQKFPYANTCLNSTQDVGYTGCASGNGYCNKTGIVCYNDYAPFLAQDCCIISGALVGLGHDCANYTDMGRKCQVKRISYASGSINEYVAHECASGYYLTSGLYSNITGCSGYGSNPSEIVGCCTACSGLVVSGSSFNTGPLGQTSSGVLIVGSSTNTGPTACKAEIPSPIVQRDNTGTFEVAFSGTTQCQYKAGVN